MDSWNRDKNGRYRMADDLIKRKLLLNADTTQVKQLIGSPGECKKVDEWVYYISSGGGFGFTDHFLTITFKSNKVYNLKHTSRPG